MKFRHLDKLARLMTDFTVDVMQAAGREQADGRFGQLLQQLVRVTLAAGSSYRWGRRATRKREFLNRLMVSQAEFAEVIVWLEMVAAQRSEPVWNETRATAEKINQILIASLANARQPREKDSRDE